MTPKEYAVTAFEKWAWRQMSPAALPVDCVVELIEAIEEVVRDALQEDRGPNEATK
jgi:hypothetical protein